MAFTQYEVWGTLDQREELVECVPTLKEAQEIAQLQRDFFDEVYILEDTSEDLKEVARYAGL